MDAKKEKITREIYSEVLSNIKPSKLEVQSAIANANSIISRLKKIVPKSVELVIVGSIARSTNLKGDSDIDLFMLFDRKMSDKEIKKKGIEYAKRIVDKKKNESFEIKYAEHPYARLYLNDIGIKIDLVPAYKIGNIEEMATSVDRTPLHTEFINKHLSERQRDEVRVLKHMLKNNSIYGAEVKTKGFSGYLCELLVYHHGSLNSLLERAVDFKLPLYINPKDKNAKPNRQIFDRFNSRFVVIDPVDQNRNVAAGVSLESLAKFTTIARKFVENPSIKVVYGIGFSSIESHKRVVNFVKKANLNVYTIVCKVPNKSEDVVWPQLNKISGIISDQIKKFGFRTFLHMAWIEKSGGFIMYLTPKESMDTVVFTGPSVLSEKKNVSAFMKAHQKGIGIFLNDDRINALSFSRYKNVEQVLRDVLNGSLVKGRKDISFRGAKLFVNKLPKEYSESAFFELKNKFVLD